MDLSKLLEMSNRYGANPEYVLAGGGNTSVKDENTMYVKCSGTQLATLTEKGIVAMDRKALDKLMTKEYPAEDAAREAAFLADVMAARCDEDLTKRPSVEALLHNLFPQKYVLHVHPAMINGLTCGKTGEQDAFRLLGEEIIWIPICRPGYTLGCLCWEAMKEFKGKYGKDVQVVLLQNHGIFLAAESVEEMDRVFECVWAKLQAAVDREPNMGDGCIHCINGAIEPTKILKEKTGKAIRWVNTVEGRFMTMDEEVVVPLLKPFTPDHIVYCGAFPLYLKKAEDVNEALEAFVAKNGFVPKIIIVEFVGVFVMGETEKDLDKPEMLIKDAIKVAVYAESFGGPLAMTDEMTDFIIHWEAESYRKKQG